MPFSKAIHACMSFIIMHACMCAKLSKFVASSQKYFSFSWRFVTRASVSDVVRLLSNQFFTLVSTKSKLPPDSKNIFLSSAPQQSKKYACIHAYMYGSKLNTIDLQNIYS